MNYTETFDQFASRLSTMDLALYAGIGLVIWVLFKDKLSPIQKAIQNLLGNVVSKKPTPSPVVGTTQPIVSDDVFFDLVVSWKQTRDLAVRSGCSEAVKVADQMFPHLSPTVCGEKKNANQ